MEWDSEIRKRTDSYLRVKQGQREPFSEVLQRLTKAVQIGVNDSEARHKLIESLACENAKLECQKIIGPLKIRSAQWMNESCIQWMLSHLTILQKLG